MLKKSTIFIILAIITSTTVNADTKIIIGKMFNGIVERGIIISGNHSEKLSETLKKKYQKTCIDRNHKPTYSSSLPSMRLKEEIMKSKSFEYDVRKSGHSCYFSDAGQSAPHIIESYSLANIDRLIWYYTKIRLPLELIKAKAPEHYVYEQMNNDFKQKCPVMNSYSETPLNALNDPVSMFPLVIHLGEEMESIIKNENNSTDLSLETNIHKYKYIHLASPHSRANIENNNKGLNQFPFKPNKSEAIEKSYLQRYFHSVTTIIPKGFVAEPRPPVPTTKYVNPGLLFVRNPKPWANSEVASEEERKEWLGYYEKLKTLMDDSLKGESNEPTPYLLGFVDQNRTQQFINNKGFHDLALYGGNIMHGTASHVLQLLHLQEAGMPFAATENITPECWLWSFDRTLSSTWYLGFGIEFNNHVHAFHDLPSIAAPEMVHKMLTERLVSRTIQYMIDHADTNTMKHFQRHWLGLKKTLSNKELHKLKTSARVLENIIIAEHISGWTHIIRSQRNAIIISDAAATGVDFIDSFTADWTRLRKTKELEKMGYKAESSPGDGAIFHRNSYEPVTRHKSSQLIELSKH